MRYMTAGIVAAAILVTAVLSASAAPGPTRKAGLPGTLSPTTHTRRSVPGELIVRFRPGASQASRAAVLSQEDASVEKRLGLPGAVLVRVPQGKSTATAAAELEQHSDVLYAEPNFVYRIDPKPYLNDTETYLEMTAPVNLTGQAGCGIDYELNLATEFDFDYFLIEASRDRNTWDEVAGWTGSSAGDFVPLSSDLSAYDNQPSVYLRLGLVSDETDVDDGAYVDDLVVRCLSPSGEAYDSFSGTSMATPHVAGVAALYKAANPAATAAAVKAAILAGVDPIPALAGKVTTGGRLNACKTLGGACGSSPPPAPNDPRFGELWGLEKIQARHAWATQTGSSSVRVAVIDSGVALNHPDLNGNLWVNDDAPGDGIDNDGNGFPDDTNGWDFVENDRTPLDLNGHGSHVAGTIGAVGGNGVGVTGVNQDVSVMALRAGDANGSLPLNAIVNAIAYACNNGAHVVNGSFGGSGFSQALADAITAPACANTLFVFAAGNGGDDGIGDNNDSLPQYPCNYDRPPTNAVNLLCVAATGQADTLTQFSNYGAAAVQLAAPGQGILSTVPATQSLSADNFDSPLAGRWEPHVVSGLAWGPTSERHSSGGFSVADSPVEGGSPPPPPTDTQAPTDPTLRTTSHTPGVASFDRTVDVAWSGAADSQSGVDGFSYLWDAQPATVPDQVKEAEETATGTVSPPLANGSWYFHLRTRDNAGNWSSGRHLGPFVITSAPPVRCVVPNVKKKTIAQARRALAAKHCALGRVTRSYSASVKKGKIIKQSRRPGASLPRGTKVNVTVSRGRRP